MRYLCFSDIHFHGTHRFSHITDEGYTIRELEHLSCAQTLIDICNKEDIDRIVFCGDLYQAVGDNLSTQTQSAVCEFVEKISKIKPLDMLVGNHDLSGTTNFKAVHKLIPFKYFDNVTVYDSPVEKDGIVYMPYCTSDEYAATVLENIKDKKNKVVFSHLELKGINLGNGIETTHGVPLDLLLQFKMTIQGHYHGSSSYGPNIKVIGSTQRLSFKDPGKSRNNIIIYDTETNKIERRSFNCPDWLTFTDDNIDDILTTDLNNYVKVEVSSDILLTDDIKARLDLFKGKDIHIDLTRLSFDKHSSADINQDTAEDEVSIIKQFIEKTDNSEQQKRQLLDEGIRLLDKVKI